MFDNQIRFAFRSRQSKYLCLLPAFLSRLVHLWPNGDKSPSHISNNLHIMHLHSESMFWSRVTDMNGQLSSSWNCNSNSFIYSIALCIRSLTFSINSLSICIICPRSKNSVWFDYYKKFCNVLCRFIVCRIILLLLNCADVWARTGERENESWGNNEQQWNIGLFKRNGAKRILYLTYRKGQVTSQWIYDFIELRKRLSKIVGLAGERRNQISHPVHMQSFDLRRSNNFSYQIILNFFFLVGLIMQSWDHLLTEENTRELAQEE